MLVRFVVALTAIAVATPALAEPLNADAARRFVAGKQFAFTCFEGSVGSGRIFNDGSVAGVVRMGGNGPTRFMHLPPGTLYAKGDTICSNVRGAFFNPCFNLNKTSDKAFRGAISGFGFAYCDFVRGGGREMIASIAPTPDHKLPMPRSIRRGARQHNAPAPTATGSVATTASVPAAAPTTPVTVAPLPSMEQTGMRSSIPQ
jgi:hypothetical protein